MQEEEAVAGEGYVSSHQHLSRTHSLQLFSSYARSKSKFIRRNSPQLRLFMFQEHEQP